VAGQTYTDSGTATCDPAPDTEPPTQPTGLTGSADSATQVSLSWDPASDNVGVASYRVLRDGVQIGTTATTHYTDTTTSGSTTYSYQVVAADAVGNASPASDPFPVTTPAPVQVLTIPVTQDAHVNANKPNVNTGNATPFLVGTSPQIRAYLRFAVSGVGGRTVLGAQLRLYTSNGSPDGGSFFGTDGKAWTETGLTWNNKPGLVGSAVASAGAATAGSFKQVNVTPLVTGDGTVDIGVTSASTDQVGYASKQATNASRRPVLLVTVQ
jgi:chitodextrinase